MRSQKQKVLGGQSTITKIKKKTGEEVTKVRKGDIRGQLPSNKGRRNKKRKNQKRRVQRYDHSIKLLNAVRNGGQRENGLQDQSGGGGDKAPHCLEKFPIAGTENSPENLVPKTWGEEKQMTRRSQTKPLLSQKPGGKLKGARGVLKSLEAWLPVRPKGTRKKFDPCKTRAVKRGERHKRHVAR